MTAWTARWAGLNAQLPPPNAVPPTNSYSRIITPYASADADTRKMIDRELKRENQIEWFKNIIQVMGLVSGLAIALVFLFVGADLIRDDHGFAGGFVMTVDLTALVSVFVYGVKQNQAALPPNEG